MSDSVSVEPFYWNNGNNNHADITGEEKKLKRVLIPSCRNCEHYLGGEPRMVELYGITRIDYKINAKERKCVFHTFKHPSNHCAHHSFKK